MLRHNLALHRPLVVGSRRPGQSFLAGLLALISCVPLAREVCADPPAHERNQAPDDVKANREKAFFHGTIGTELMPLPVAQVLSDIYPEHFQPLGQNAGDWIEQFGFIRSKDSASLGLPVGFTISESLPGTGEKAPIPFVGLGCATCHTALIRRSIDDPGYLVTGTGNPSLNLFSWLDAFQAATLQKVPVFDPKDPKTVKDWKLPIGVKEEELLTVGRVVDAYKRKFSKDLTTVEQQVIGQWLGQLALQQAASLPRFDQPFGHGRSMDPKLVPTGPSRTQPFRTLVRAVLQRPGSTMQVYTKIAPVYQEALLDWAQVDGGIRDIRIRSALAAMAAGATVQILAKPEVVSNIELATDYTKDLAGPKYNEVFPELAPWISRQAVDRGKVSYMKHCNGCHGHPDSGNPAGWNAAETGSRLGVVIPYAEIGTDPERVTFRYFDELPEMIFQAFPADHPFHFERQNLRPGPLGHRKGYITKPLDSAFSRAPYLHNASVNTLAELINLEPRSPVFYRGHAIYDPENVGLRASPSKDRTYYFRFDTSLPGNSNRGHDYPWPYQGPGWDKAELSDLLQYLKTL
jgi:mono/diheme cytochrome c family protein